MSLLNKAWLDFLVTQGATLRDGPTPDIEAFTPQAGAAGEPDNGFIAPLTHLGLIIAEGEEAASFLHNQLTNDILGLTPQSACLAGYCSPKGRLLATMLVWRTEHRVMMALPREILPAILKRLQMFVLRAKVKLHDASDTHVMLGVTGGQTALPGAYFATTPAAPYSVVQADCGSLLRIADAGGLPRFVVTLARTEEAMQIWQSVTATLPAAAPAAWRCGEIFAGVPQITLATLEQFVPQMINFEIVGGVNFRKGCYPGQEIVARSQYLGKFKRRMLLASVDAATVPAATEVFADNDPGQPCGMVVNAERGPDGRFACLVEMKLDAIDAAVHLGAPDGPLLRFGRLPYELTPLS